MQFVLYLPLGVSTKLTLFSGKHSMVLFLHLNFPAPSSIVRPTILLHHIYLLQTCERIIQHPQDLI